MILTMVVAGLFGILVPVTLKKMNIDLDRRVLAELAAEDSEAFSNLVSLAKENAA